MNYEFKLSENELNNAISNWENIVKPYKEDIKSDEFNKFGAYSARIWMTHLEKTKIIELFRIITN